MLPISNTWRGVRYRIRRDISMKRTAIAWQKALGMQDVAETFAADIEFLQRLLRASYDTRRRRQKGWKWQLDRYKV